MASRCLPVLSLLLVPTVVPGEPTEPPPVEPADTRAPGVAESSHAPHDDVASRLDQLRTPRAGLLELGPVSVLERAWRSANDRLDEASGLRFGLAYTLTFQAATPGPGDRSGAEGDLDLFGVWRLIGEPDEPDTGTLNLNAQHIHSFGETAPANLGADLGADWGTSDGIGSDETFSLVQLYYEQRLLSDRLLIVVGKIDTTNYINTNRYADDTLYFMNRAFSSDPALNYPGNGLGLVIAGRITDTLYAGACIADANGDETRSGFDTVGDAEFFTAAEIGLNLDIAGLGAGNYRFTAWHSDRASEAGLPEDAGVALSIDQEFGGGFVPFFRAAWSDADATGVPLLIAAGVAVEGAFGRADDVCGLGLSWGRSDDEALNDQVVAEAFYRLQLAPSIQWTVGAQSIFNARDADTGDDETVGVLELRLRVIF